MRQKMHRGHRTAGFSLIELLIVVAIILVIVAIAIPNLLQSRMAANETSAAYTMRTLHTAFVTYSTTYQNGYPQALDWLGPAGGGITTCNQAGLVEPMLAINHIKAGYVYTYAAVGPPLPVAGVGCAAPGITAFTLNADPGPNGSDRGRVGRKSFYMEDSGIIRFNMTTAAGPTDAPIPAGG